MASLISKKDTKYLFCCFTLPDGTRTTRSTKQTKRREAMQVCMEMERVTLKARNESLTETQARRVVSDIVERASGEPIVFQNIIEWFESWLEMKEEAKSKGTHVRYKGVIEEFIVYLGKKGKKNLTMLNQKDVHGFRSKLKKDGLSNTSCNQAVKIISTSLNSALRQGIIPMNPAAAVESLPKEKSVRKPFTKAQLKKLIKASDNEWRIAILMGFYTGARLRDIADMTWESINFEKGTINFIAGKTKKETIIPIHPSLKEALLDAAGQDDPTASIFTSMAGKGTGGAHGLSSTFAKIMSKANIDPQSSKAGIGKARTKNSLSFHSHRHSFNSRLASEDIAGEVRRKLTGHSSDEMNQNYTHLELEKLREAVNVMPEL